MKKIIYLLLLIIMTACQTESEISVPELSNNTELWKRDIFEALNIAQKATTIGVSSTRGLNRQRIANKNSVFAIKAENTRGTNSSPLDTLLYIINYDNNQGYAVVSASKFTEGLIAVIDTGTYDGSFNGSPAFNLYMEEAKNYVISESEKRLKDSVYCEALAKGPKPLIIEDVILEEHVVEPKVHVNWGQRSIEGLQCPNEVAGCGNIAVTQIMTYYKHPSSIQLTYADSVSGQLNLDWDNICQHKIYPYYCNCSNETHLAIGKLIRQIGHISNSNYIKKDKDASTSTETDSSRYALTTLGYTVGNVSYYSQGIFDDYLMNGKLLFVRGEKNNGAGHAWIVDGCDYKTVRHTEFAGIILIYESIASFNYNHINWGWYGKGNGYFIDGIFNAVNHHSYDYYYDDYEKDNNYFKDLLYFSVYHE